MILSEYLEELAKIVRENPKALNYQVVYAQDDEGNDYNLVGYSPTLGNYEDREFTSVSGCLKEQINAVCLN